MCAPFRRLLVSHNPGATAVSSLPFPTPPALCPLLLPLQIDDAYVDEYISISQFPLSAAYALGRITNALEQKWGII